MCFKGTVSQDLYSYFFMILTHWGLYAYGEVFFKICIHMFKKLCAVIDTAESDYAVALIPRRQASPWHWQRWIRLHIVIDTPESSFAMTLTTLNQTPQCHWYPGVKLRNDIDNTESDSAVSLIPRSQASQLHWQRWIRLHSVNDTPESYNFVHFLRFYSNSIGPNIQGLKNFE